MFPRSKIALGVGEKAWSTKHRLQLALVSANSNDFMDPAIPLDIHVATEKLDLVSAKTLVPDSLVFAVTKSNFLGFQWTSRGFAEAEEGRVKLDLVSGKTFSFNLVRHVDCPTRRTA